MAGLNPWVLLAAVAVWIASLAGAAKLGYDYSQGEVAKEELTEERVRNALIKVNQKFADDVGVRVERGLSKIRVTNQTINNEVQREREVHYKVLDNPDCNLPDSTRRLLNRARGYGQDGPGTREPPGAVPPDAGTSKPDAAGGSGGR